MLNWIRFLLLSLEPCRGPGVYLEGVGSVHAENYDSKCGAHAAWRALLSELFSAA